MSTSNPCDDYYPTDGICKCGYNEQSHYPHVTPRACTKCGEAISLERLDAFPITQHCKNCANHAPKKIYDPEIYCAKSSQSSLNGFSRSD